MCFANHFHDDSSLFKRYWPLWLSALARVAKHDARKGHHYYTRCLGLRSRSIVVMPLAGIMDGHHGRASWTGIMDARHRVAWDHRAYHTMHSAKILRPPRFIYHIPIHLKTIIMHTQSSHFCCKGPCLWRIDRKYIGRMGIVMNDSAIW
jgi:hypothetical protein